MDPGHSARLRQAVDNHIGWYTAMAASHQIGFEVTADAWWTPKPMPPYYSNYHVVRRGAEHLARIGHLIAESEVARFSVADTYADLDPSAMVELGFRPLFDAQWYGVSAATPRAAADPGAELSLRQVQEPRALSDWENRWRQWSPCQHPPIFVPALAAREGVQILDVMRGAEPIGGCVFFTAAGCTGLSNAFVDSHAADAAILLRLLSDALSAQRPVAGYASQEVVTALVQQEVVALGTHRIWRREP